MLWLYDSFEGLPAKTRRDNSAAGDAFQAGELLVTKREVIEEFRKWDLNFLKKSKKAFFDDLDIIYDIPEKISCLSGWWFISIHQN